MKKALLLLTVWLPLTLLSQPFSLRWIDQDAQAKASRMKSFVQQTHSQSGVLSSGMDIRFHRMHFTVDPARRYISGSVMTWFVPKADNHQMIVFDMHDSLQVDAIRYHGSLLTRFVHENHKLSIQLPNQPTGLDSVEIVYAGAPVDDGMDAFTVSSHAGKPILYTLSEPYGARNWWPCSQDLNDKIDSVDLFITVPSGNRAAANGMLIAEHHDALSSTYEWKHKHPIAAYLIGISVTNYVYYSDYVPLDSGDSIQILNYVYPENLAEIKTQTKSIIKPFQLYNHWFGLYPFANERYGHAQWEWGGGMEHQTMSFMGSFGYDLMAHELAHQWFGDYVTCGSWRDVWLNEGFATYLVGLCYETDLNGLYWEPFKRLSINRILTKPGGSVYCYDTTDIDRVFDSRLSYSKGGMVLHMLRWEMGDHNFFQALNNYLNDPALANGYATTEDLIRQVEAVTGTSYREFFNDWVYGAGYPTYQIIYRLNADNEVELELSQTTSDPSVSFFEMDIPIQLIGTDTVTVIAHHSYNGQLFRFNPGFAVRSVVFDPDRWICTASPVVLNVSDLPLDQQVKIYPNPVTDLLTIQFPLPSAGITIRLFNQTGQCVRSVDMAGSSQVSIPMGALPGGYYTVEIPGKSSVKILKQ